MPKSPKPAASTATPTTPRNAIAELPTAGVIRRIAALIYDAFLLFGLLVVPLFIAIAVFSARQEMPQDSVAHELPSIAPKPILLLYMVAMTVGFYCYFWRKSGQTLGMQAWRLRLDSRAGGRATLHQCLVRAAVGFVSLLCAGLGYWWIWIDKDRASWHDRASNTRVVVLPKKKN